MHSVLRRLDLNLLLVFEALLRLRTVAAAAEELAMSPSAFSHALARLRTTLADDLFVRIGHIMQPTALAEDMAEAVCAALEMLAIGLAETREFDPRTSDRTFVLAATDYTAFTVLPPFIAHMQDVAPGLRFKVVYSSGRESTDDLATGRIDFAFGYVEGTVEPTPGIESFDWLVDEYVIIASKNHPTIQRNITLDQYLGGRHVVVTPWNETTSAIGQVLNRLNLKRDVAVQLPSLLAAPFIISRSSLIMTLPRYAAKILQDSAPISIYPAPFPIPPFTLKIYGHVRHSRNKAHTWIREKLLEAGASCQI